MSDIPPPVIAPPVYQSSPEGTYIPPEAGPPKNDWKGKAGGVGALALLAAKWGKAAWILFKSVKFLPTLVSMVLSIGIYAVSFGWPFAVGFVLCIFVHELGHVYFAKREGVAVSAPFFIPFFGALIAQKEIPKTAFSGALIGIGGPLFGTAAALACWVLFEVTGNPLFLALAYTGFFLNLFNMAPVYPLDGGRITACVSPYLLIVGYVLLILAAVFGFVRNPLIWILVIVSVPQVWSMLKKGSADEDEFRTSPKQRWGMGVAYVSLACFLAWAMGHTHYHDALQRHQRPQPQHSQVAINV